jgi:NADH-quinone oxidoreductase subunit D
VDGMPEGDFKNMDPKLTPPPRAELNRSMEAVIHHFKLQTQGYTVPAGETYAAVESPRGELGVYAVSDGGTAPYRVHVRDPSFANLQALAPMVSGGLVADLIASIASIDPIMGGVDR